jgi:hypothetical protein
VTEDERLDAPIIRREKKSQNVAVLSELKERQGVNPMLISMKWRCGG